jgi:hypothetical protein
LEKRGSFQVCNGGWSATDERESEGDTRMKEREGDRNRSICMFVGSLQLEQTTSQIELHANIHLA